ncbi:MAG: polysaccharide biosynthesis/export family protein [Leptolyngbyaceae cyanobacterium]
MVLIKNATASQVSLDKKLGLLASQLLLGLVFWSLCQVPSRAQLEPLPAEEELAPAQDDANDDEELPLDADEAELPSVERLERRPTLEDLDPRIRTGTTPSPVENAFEQYRLGPGDGIFVSVQRFPDLSFQATLDQQGNVILPIEGAVSLEGLTLNEAENRIRAVYNQYVVLAEVRSIGLAEALQGLPYQAAETEINRRIIPDYQTLRSENPRQFRAPDVTLTLTAQRGVEIVMLGEIERPGLYPLEVPRLTAALLAAGGARSTADLRQVRIQRRLPDNNVIEKTVDLYTPIRDGDPMPEERLENGDVVIISRLDPAQAQDYDVNFVTRSTLAQPNIVVRVFNYPAGVAGGRVIPNGSTFADALVGDSVRGGDGIGLPLNQANLRSVALIRFDPEEGEPVVLKLNAKDAIYGDPTQNPPLRDNDVIVVGRNLINRITFAINTITQPFQDTLSFLLFFDNFGDLFDDD